MRAIQHITGGIVALAMCVPMAASAQDDAPKQTLFTNLAVWDGTSESLQTGMYEGASDSLSLTRRLDGKRPLSDLMPILENLGLYVIDEFPVQLEGGNGTTFIHDFGVLDLDGAMLDLDDVGAEEAMFVGHDWGSMVVWDLSRLHPARVRGLVNVSVPYTAWPARPTDLFRALFGDRFFYIVYFQEVGPAEAELEADVAETLRLTLWGGSGEMFGPPPDPLPPMEGTGLVEMLVVEEFEGPPGFVYGILVTIFVFFNCFAVNQWLQYRGVGKWTDYVYGEKVYLVLSLAAKSLLAWQIYFPSLD